MNKDRREFLQKAARIGGLTAIMGLGGHRLVDECLASNIFISGHKAATADENTSWATWDEVTEAGWGDSANTYIALMESGVGANEIGLGITGLSEANRTLTQNGDIPGASGGYRTLNGTGSQYFTFTAGWITAIFGNPSWIYIIKLIIDAADPYGGLFVYDAAEPPDELIYMRVHTDGKLEGQVKDPSGYEDLSTTDSVTTGSIIWCAFWTNNTSGKTRMGFSTTRPTKWSNFSANSRREFALCYDGIVGDTACEYNYIGRVATLYIKAQVAYIIASKNPGGFIDDSV